MASMSTLENEMKKPKKKKKKKKKKESGGGEEGKILPVDLNLRFDLFNTWALI